MKELIQKKLNTLGKAKTPTLFVISYDLSEFYIEPLESLDEKIEYAIEKTPSTHTKGFKYSFESVPVDKYKKSFDKIIENIKSGNSYLTNLTFASKFSSKSSLKEIYEISDAKFKLYFKDRFICFSPERFINIKDNKIYTYPMKGTIDAKIKDAKKKILADKKEMAEHVMVVDLLRNDLSMVGTNITVEKFRYIDTIKAGDRELLQVSSKISADLKEDWSDNLGDIVTTLLPAGSITGTPKRKTVEIIKEIEDYERGFFSGVFGVYDGESLDSGVMIRFIEKTKSGDLIYKSGGGITIDSKVQSEYDEMKEKVYVPVF